MRYACRCGNVLAVRRKRRKLRCSCGRKMHLQRDSDFPCRHRGRALDAIDCQCGGVVIIYSCRSEAVEQQETTVHAPLRNRRMFRHCAVCALCESREPE